VVYLYYLLLIEGFGSVQITTDPDPYLRGPETFGSGTGTLLDRKKFAILIREATKQFMLNKN
jgi:hypothetical protein